MIQWIQDGKYLEKLNFNSSINKQWRIQNEKFRKQDEIKEELM